ncbi:hypothetical protein N7532_002034 [Penicillium argentinense]|uniref:Uncharacterized protein n=1 Tax=Penicillium argentinense TaxID=1131581 RepID=A0A9W9G3N3_9EURO|nr:uncharacterized protein N7532_002034 [Penicillium argentinense]KAJ5111499.1 hypothetical protein N7532_002034 [Penicillium argentinense]
MAAMDCGAAKMPAKPCLPAPIQTHIRNQDSYSSSLSHDAMGLGEPIPSPRRWSPTYQPRSRSRQFPNSLSFVPPPAMPRSEHEVSPSLPRFSMDRGQVSISPFRSVRRMKEPFQLMLPSSPASVSSPVSASCDGAPPFAAKTTRQSKLPAGHSLRTWRSDQNLTSTSMSAFGLLPSPPISDSRPASTGPESYFAYQNCSKASCDEGPYELEAPDVPIPHESQPQPLKEEPEEESPPVETQTEDESKEQLAYQSYRPWQKPVEHRMTDVKNVHEAHTNLMRRCDTNESESTPTEKERLPVPFTSPASEIKNPTSAPGSSPRPQRPRTATVSSEASWIPSNFSYCKTWLQGVPLDPLEDQEDENPRVSNRRKFQIIEKDPPMPPLDVIPGAKALDEPVRFAVASKPKLVEIARQSSPSVAPSPSLAPSLAPSPAPPPVPPHTVPMTPDQNQEEVSAFSPDTPLENPPDMSDSGYGTRESGYSLDSFQDSKDDDSYTDPGSLTSDSVTSTVVCERPDSAQEERDTSPKPEIRSGSVSPQASPTTPAHPSPGRISQKSGKDDMEKQGSWHQEWTIDDHEWTLGELEHCVKDFPRHMLRLTSPVIVFLRKNDEKALLRPFHTIFPEVTENLLDCLCAALIARNYLLSLSSIHRRKPSLSTRNDIYAVDAVPAKAYSTLGIQLPTGSPSRVKDRFLGSRSSDLRQHVEKIVDNLLFAICGRADDMLKSAVEVLAQVLETKAQ